MLRRLSDFATSRRRRGGDSYGGSPALPSSLDNSPQGFRNEFEPYIYNNSSAKNKKKGLPVIRIVAGLAVVLVIVVWWMRKDGPDRQRELGGRKVMSRDWRGDKIKVNFSNVKASSTERVPTVMIMCTMKDSLEHIWHFFQLIDTLDYPRSKLQIAILVSDTQDRTYERALELADERQYKRPKKQQYGRIVVLRKDFAMEDPSALAAMGGIIPAPARMPSSSEKLEAVSADRIVGAGKARHAFGGQIHRRKMLGVSRTWLLTSAMTPDIDYALWIDVDVVDYDKRLVQTLLEHSVNENADVVVPNCVWKTYNELGSYDRNNWQETHESTSLKQTLQEEEVLIEGEPKLCELEKFSAPLFAPTSLNFAGYEDYIKTKRLNMADMVPFTPQTPSVIPLDGVGGCTALIIAGLHRKGAIFPAWPVDHQLETEGFAQLAKKFGGRMVGLPKYYVFHGE
ncbi:BQ5605_C064g12789 [Microbotryum silenes-dioicae]|uniref:BQ5605_C064g12789 protein n=1 Tax=Microbotryum silenes-dioicae TaxID=796604 RepID=A0A2X0MUS7_9BASI|nr:BQ5605_C064g12789 [Microbotryum silenes-dioicae]